TRPLTDGTASLIFIIVVASALLSLAPQPPAYRATVLFIGAHGAAWMLLSSLSGNEGAATRAFFLLLFACWLLARRRSDVSCRPPTHGAVNDFRRN
ncbi:ABC transporter permease, partial [Rhizobium ruizarguesonis]